VVKMYYHHESVAGVLKRSTGRLRSPQQWLRRRCRGMHEDNLCAAYFMQAPGRGTLSQIGCVRDASAWTDKSPVP